MTQPGLKGIRMTPHPFVSTVMRQAGPAKWPALVAGALLLLQGTGTVRLQAAPGSSFRVIYGTAKEVTPNSVTVQAPDLKEVTIATREDFTGKVAAGSKVTAWYYRQGGGYALRWLSYSLENDFVAPARIVSEVKSVALLPDSKMEGANTLDDMIAGFLKENLGWRVAPKMWADYIRKQLQAPRSTLEAFDARTGKFDLKGYSRGEDPLIPTLARRARVNAVLEIKIEQVKAPVSHQVAVWDGMEDPLSGKAMRTVSKIDLIPLKQEKVPATTVVLKLWSPEQRLLWSNRRGLAALERYQGLREKLVSWPLENSLYDSQNTDRWLKMVFQSFLPFATPPKHLD
jgi:hypothetical protein